MQYDGNASVRSCLQKEDGSHGSKTKGTVDSAEAGSGTSLGVAVRLAGRLVAVCAGVDELALAVELALDELLVLERLVEAGACVADITSRLQVEGTLDAIKGRCLNASHRQYECNFFC